MSIYADINRMFPKKKNETNYQIKEIESGYNYVDITYKDCLSWGGLCICDRCNRVYKNGKLVWALQDTLCPKCFKEWERETKDYKKAELEYDLQLQKQVSKEYYDIHMRRDKLSDTESFKLWTDLRKDRYPR